MWFKIFTVFIFVLLLLLNYQFPFLETASLCLKNPFCRYSDSLHVISIMELYFLYTYLNEHSFSIRVLELKHNLNQ